MSRVIFGISTDFLGADIVSFRRRLGFSQDALARELGCSVATVSQWEQNRHRPSESAIQKMRMLAQMRGLVPDDGTRALFGLKSQISDFQSWPPANARAPADDAELLRYFNTAATALSLLYEAAAAGHPGAKTVLRSEAERLLKRGAEWRDAKYRKSK